MTEEEIRIGLCLRCRYHSPVVSGKGSHFILCAYSRIDPSYPKYPRLPVLTCAAMEPSDPAASR